ncbi:hypothetical protein RGQ29_021909 [Quercus rubra]|uniref:L-ascorbate oxidase n=1 Tax=Quercus rubra TaxID=3512 RepID=A0AAN7F133_QUERU|nr:hypothetical protein RGQ29_021909 [Quercus rubra]
MLKLLALYFFTTLIHVPITEAKIREYNWEVKYEYKSPDCFRKQVITINGLSPGPTILAQQGDTVIVNVKNKLITESFAIHWHGIRQRGTPWSDGTAWVTQCPIGPGDTVTYEFKADRPGTYVYHAHYGMQRTAGLYGSIQVSLPDGVEEPFAYDFDQSILLNDWYHQSTSAQATGLTSIPYMWVGEPQSLLIQGKGKFNCSSVTLPTNICNTTNPECSPYVITVIPGKTYRLRIASLTALSALSFQIEGHKMTVVEADGYNVEPFEVDKLYIYSGETYSVIVKADQDTSRNYWATTNVISRHPNTPPGLAIFNYEPNEPQQSPPTVPPAGPVWNDTADQFAQSQALKARQGYIHSPPPTSDRTLVFLTTQNTINGYTRWAVNNVSLDTPDTPFLIALKYNLPNVMDQTPPPDTYDSLNYDINNVAKNKNATSSTAIYRLKFNTTVDVIMQNANTMKISHSETHPWHLHGHDFWVLGNGIGKFDLKEDTKKFNLVNPVMKNTVPVFPFGWTALRFQADNPGVWAFHCHLEPHFYLGMGVAFEAGVEKVGKLPTFIMGCGQSRGLLN